MNGAGSRIRTDDLLITNQLLYQLSYAGKNAPEISAESQLRQEMPNLRTVSFRSKKQPGTKRSIGIGIIDAVDTCTPKMMLVQTKKIFVTAEAIKKDVFAIFPARLFHFRHLGDSRATANQSLLDLRPGESKISVPRKSPDDLTRTGHLENVFRKVLPSGRFVNLLAICFFHQQRAEQPLLGR